MAVITQEITDKYAAYNGDSCEVLPNLPTESVGHVLYSPPFAGLFVYSSSERDLSNARTYEEFMEHYEFIVRETHRLLMPGRICAVHCMDVPRDGANYCGYIDFPGDIIRLHERLGFQYLPRICVWKEPLEVRNRTMIKYLAHWTIVEDSTQCTVAAADYILPFRKRGANPIPVAHPTGLHNYAGSREVPYELHKYKGYKGKQTLNRYSHWIWRHYASCFWDDVRLSRMLPYLEARDSEDERHMHPLQLDVIERCVVLWSNPGETVLTPFMGVGSEVAGALMNGRKGVGVELKPTYYRQALKNLKAILESTPQQQEMMMFNPEDFRIGSSSQDDAPIQPDNLTAAPEIAPASVEHQQIIPNGIPAKPPRKRKTTKGKPPPPTVAEAERQAEQFMANAPAVEANQQAIEEADAQADDALAPPDMPTAEELTELSIDQNAVLIFRHQETCAMYGGHACLATTMLGIPRFLARGLEVALFPHGDMDRVREELLKSKHKVAIVDRLTEVPAAPVKVERVVVLPGNLEASPLHLRIMNMLLADLLTTEEDLQFLRSDKLVGCTLGQIIAVARVYAEQSILGASAAVFAAVRGELALPHGTGRLAQLVLAAWYAHDPAEVDAVNAAVATRIKEKRTGKVTTP